MCGRGGVVGVCECAPPPSSQPAPHSSRTQVKTTHNQFKKAVRSVCRGTPQVRAGGGGWGELRSQARAHAQHRHAPPRPPPFRAHLSTQQDERFMNEAAGQEMTVADYFRQQVSGRRLMCMHARACKCARSLSPRAPPACPPPNLPSRPPSRAPHPPTPHCVQYNISLKNHELPCVAVGNGKVLLPPELCIIAPGQVGGCGWLCGVRALPSPPTAHTPQPSSRLPPPPLSPCSAAPSSPRCRPPR